MAGPLLALTPLLKTAMAAIGSKSALTAATEAITGGSKAASTGAAAAGVASKGGKLFDVIEGLIPGTGNAKSLTRMLAGLSAAQSKEPEPENEPPEAPSVAPRPAWMPPVQSSPVTQPPRQRAAAATGKAREKPAPPDLSGLVEKNKQRQRVGQMVMGERRATPSAAGFRNILTAPPPAEKLQLNADLQAGDRSQRSMRSQVGFSRLLPSPPKPDFAQQAPVLSPEEEKANKIKDLIATTKVGGIAAMALQVPGGKSFAKGASAGMLAGGAVGGPAGAAAGGGLGGILGITTAFGMKLNDLAKRFEALGAATLESVRHLQRFSPSLARLFAQMEVQERRLGMQFVRGTAGSRGLLGGQLMNLRQEFQPIRELGGTLKNLSSAGLVAIGRILVYALNGMIMPIDKVAKALESLLGKEEKEAPIANLFNALAFGQVDRPFKNQRPGGQ